MKKQNQEKNNDIQKKDVTELTLNEIEEVIELEGGFQIHSAD